MKRLIYPICLVSAILLIHCREAETETADVPPADASKPRTIVTTDGEIDDVDSFIRLLLYANEFRIEGLVYSSSMWHYKGDGRGTPFVSEMEMTRQIYGEKTDLRWPGTSWMQDLIGEYAKVYPNLQKHADGYPDPQTLRSLIRVGNIEFEGEMEKDTEGSRLIAEKLMDNDTTPLYLQVWGGTNTIARALKSIEEEFGDSGSWETIYREICSKAVIYAIMDQDATYRKYIAPNWPDLKVYYNSNQFWCFAYPWKQQVPEPWHAYLEGPFMKEHLIKGHGPLLERYYSYGDGQKQQGDPEHIHGVALDSFNQGSLGQNWGPFKPYDFISEGDSPAYLHLVDVGLDNIDNPSIGGWGGRLLRSESQPNRWEDGGGVSDFNPFTDTLDVTYPQTRWIPAIQEDFAARADWCVTSYAAANHPPEVQIAEGNRITAKPGEEITLTGMGADPDGDSLQYLWWRYAEVDGYSGELLPGSVSGNTLKIKLPEDMAPGEDVHLILEVSDVAEHPMTRYQRVIITAR
ncbi:DUF1593 domain-containing protein [Robiginitalea sp. SC105]|uniref:DUF1593 domain-containing protein n=1 Tax=Robiginitalea sp. SC105 TaxID=2762332 RepID=UPI00163A13A7|nr:DUF1593 domain-containing protein [Robiginitalea sp. SC105]MBC2840277.1 DUF1593 domain-containing protein [Robiginitalea sp. SC105]